MDRGDAGMATVLLPCNICGVDYRNHYDLHGWRMKTGTKINCGTCKHMADLHTGYGVCVATDDAVACTCKRIT